MYQKFDNETITSKFLDIIIPTSVIVNAKKILNNLILLPHIHPNNKYQAKEFPLYKSFPFLIFCEMAGK